jgi:hypothetical protein
MRLRATNTTQWPVMCPTSGWRSLDLNATVLTSATATPKTLLRAPTTLADSHNSLRSAYTPSHPLAQRSTKRLQKTQAEGEAATLLLTTLALEECWAS